MCHSVYRPGGNVLHDIVPFVRFVLITFFIFCFDLYLLNIYYEFISLTVPFIITLLMNSLYLIFLIKMKNVGNVDHYYTVLT